MIFPAAELRQINLQCLDATQIPSGSRKIPTIEQEKEKRQVQNSGCESQGQKQNQSEPAQGGTGNVGEFPVGKGHF